MITSVSNEKIKEIEALLKKPSLRKERGLFVVEGIKQVGEIPETMIEKVYVSESFAASHKLSYDEIVSDKVFARMSDTQTPQGILALVKMMHYELPELVDQAAKTPGAFLILERLQDPGNLGTVLRSAEGAGITAVIMDEDTVDIYNPKVVRSTMGSVYRVPFVISGDLKADVTYLKQHGVSVYAAHLKGTVDYDHMDYLKAAAFMIGNESQGLSEALAEMADHYIKIPMLGRVESLNAAVAASLLSYELARQRRNA